VATIDDKVVAMSFESSKFEQGVNKTISALDKLKAALNFPHAGKGLDDINAAAKRVDLGHIGKGIEEVSGKLSALRLTAIALFSQLASKAIAAGTSFVKAFTLDPIKAGFSEYTTKLNSVQTILANTQSAGVGLKQVNATLQELNEYSDKTIYNFGQMAKNIGTFTAAGVDIKTATGAIKGIANLAALSGSNADQAATAMYQLSQAISAGRVGLQDWNSVVNAGMGGTVFQRALAQTAVAMGTLKENSLKLVGPMKNVSINGESFRQSMQAGPGKASWLSSKVLTTTLKQFTGDLKDSELAAMGFNDAQIKAIQQTAKTAMHAATEVKSLNQVLDVAKETAGSGWAETWQIIFGDFGEAKKTFTDLSNTINGFINANADARNKILADWKALGGRTILIDSIKTAFHNLGLIIKPIKEAFRDIFPATTGKDLLNLTLRFKAFAEALRPSAKTVNNLKRTFRGLFALLDIGKQVLGGIFGVFGQLFGALGGAGGGFLEITAKIGDWLYSVDQALKKGERLNKFFDGIKDVIAVPIAALGNFARAIRNMLGFDSGGISGQLGEMTSAMNPFQKAMEVLSNTVNRFIDELGQLGEILQPVLEAYMSFLQSLGPAITKAVSNMNFDAILQVIRTGLFGALILMLRQFLGKGGAIQQIIQGLLGAKGIGGPLGAITGIFNNLGGALQAWQTNLKAKTLKELAIAIALIVASVVALSFVDPKKLNSAMAAMVIMFGQLLGAMAILDKISKSAGFIRLPIIAASLVILAGAIDLLTIAVLAMSLLDWNQLIKGLTGVGALLTGIVVATGPLSKASPRLIAAGAGVTALAIGLNIMALAVRQLGSMNTGMLTKGLAGVAIGLTTIALAAKLMPVNMLLTGAGLIAVAIGLRILAESIQKFGGMEWGVIGKGIVGVGLALVAIALAMKLMPPNMILTAAGLLVVSLALGKIVDAVASMGGMSIGTIAKGLIALALSLAILAAAMHVMQGAIGGAVALTIAAAGITLLAGSLKTLGGMSWGEIIKGLVALAAVFVVIGGAAVLMSSAIPAMLGFGVALILIGAGLALAGAGIALIGIGLSAIAVAAPTAVGVILAAFVEFQQGVIKSAKLLVLGLLEIVKSFADVAPKFVDALIKILNSLLDAIPKLMPKLKVAIDSLIELVVAVLHSNQGKIVQAGFDLILALLQGIKNNIGAIVQAVVDIVAQLLGAIARNISRIARAGLQIVVALIRGISSYYGKIVGAAIIIVTKFIGAIANLYGKIATAGLTILTKLLGGIARNIGKVVTAAANIIAHFITGIGNAGPKIITAATNAMIKFINALQKNANKLTEAGAVAIVKFLNGVAKSLEQHVPEMRSAGIRIGVAIIDGMTFGLASKAGGLLKKAGDLANKIKDKIKKPWKLFSPSKVAEEIGANIILGLANGLSDNAEAVNVAGKTSQSVIDMFNAVFQTNSPSKVTYAIGRDVINGFALGLKKGTEEDIKAAFSDLRAKFGDQIRDLRGSIAEENKKLSELKKGKEDKEEKAEIKALTKELERNELALKKVVAAQTLLRKGLAEDKGKLLAKAKEYAELSDKIETVTQVIQDLKDQYAELPEFPLTDEKTGKALTGAQQLEAYLKALAAQSVAVAKYNETLLKLKELGLDDTTYQMLLEKGTSGQAFADALVAGGKPAVNNINALDAKLGTAAGTLGENAAAKLYNAGVKAAEGLIKGLESKKADLAKTMTELADTLVRRIKKQLKMKSPSAVFAEIGALSMEGLAKGFSDSSKLVTDAVDVVANDALTQLEKSMRDISDVVTEQLNPNPTITPILDLTQVQSKRAELDALTNVVPITAAVSTGQASAISAAQRSVQEQYGVADGGSWFKFEQNNYSPEALSNIDIYRQTKNQLSLVKNALARP
jgi:tape measure domain-containing protein